MRTGVYVALLAQLVLSVLQIAIGPFLLVFVGFPRLDRLHCIYNLNKDDGTKKRESRQETPEKSNSLRRQLRPLVFVPTGDHPTRYFCNCRFLFLVHTTSICF